MFLIIGYYTFHKEEFEYLRVIKIFKIISIIKYNILFMTLRHTIKHYTKTLCFFFFFFFH